MRILLSRKALKEYLRCLNLRLGQDLPISVKDGVILPFPGFNFRQTSHIYMQSFLKIKPTRKLPNLQCL